MRLDTRTGIALAFVIAALLFLAVLLGGCGGRQCPKCPIPPPLEVKIDRVDCMSGPPPIRPGPLIDPCEGAAGCLTRANLEKLFVYLAALDQYSQEAWINCGPAPANPKEN